MFSVVPPRQLSANFLPALKAIQKASQRHRQAKAVAQANKLAAAAAAVAAATAAAASKSEAASSSEEKVAAGTKSGSKTKVAEKGRDIKRKKKNESQIYIICFHEVKAL